ncbi:hypothetical protein [Microbulbifer sediminum]|uniref:PglD-related sugar-binding protein n=1 Tax=Microbulbifer sediminum TaxID=2904250 RepID=UPI001F429121|nr:hypothetical protein [Microbulbifer sediminum]
MISKVAIFGSAGFASEIVDLCDDLNIREIVFIEKTGEVPEKHGIPIFSEEEIPRLTRDNFNFAIGVSDPGKRQAISNLYPNLPYANLIHSSATFGRAQYKKLVSARGIVIAAGARLMSNISLGNFVVIGVNATVGHDCEIGDYSTILPGANVSGNVCLKRRVYIGTNATVLQGAEGSPLVLGGDIMVGAGAVVTKSFKESGVLIGVPAKYKPQS